MDVKTILFIGLTVYSYLFMKYVLKNSPRDGKLTKNEKVQVIITLLLNIIPSWAIYYLGWNKKLPIKAQQVNKYVKNIIISLISIAIIGFLLAFLLIAINPVNQMNRFKKNNIIPQDKSQSVPDQIYNSDKLKIIIPPDWKRYDNEPGDINTLVYIEKNNGIANISIDNTQNYSSQPNSVTIKKYTPMQILQSRLNSIENIIKNDPNLNWQNFRIVDKVKAIDFKGHSAADGSFIVDENILGKGKITERKIKRIIVFTKDDLWNIVFASTNSNVFNQEEKEFDKFLDSLVIK